MCLGCLCVNVNLSLVIALVYLWVVRVVVACVECCGVDVLSQKQGSKNREKWSSGMGVLQN